jgi:hypothetical protein
MTEQRVLLGRIPAAVALAALGSAVCNLGLWWLGQQVDRMTISAFDVALFSVLGAVAGGMVFALLGLKSRYPVRWFLRISVAVVVLYLGGPIIAAYEPYMEGAALFNVTTIVATELMHLVSAAWVVLLLTRRAAAPRTA